MLGHSGISDMHAWVQARLSDYIDQQLATNERTQLDQHLGECANCRARLGELRWTLALIKESPAPATKKSFVLPVPSKRQPSFAFGMASFGAALAAILLVAMISFDLISQRETSVAFAPAAQSAMQPLPTQAIALAPVAAPTNAPRPTSIAPMAGAASSAAASSSSAVSSFAMSSASSSAAALPPAPAFAQPTQSKSASAADNATTSEASGAVKAQPTALSARSPSANGAAISPTVIALAPAKSVTPIPPTQTLVPSPTVTPVPPTATIEPTTVAKLNVLPTRAPNGPVQVESPPLFSTTRLIEIGLLAVTVFLIVLAVLLRRNQS